MAKVIDADSGTVDWLGLVKKDLMPTDLMCRAFGRLNANCPDENIGLLSSYMEIKSNGGKWFPEGRAAKFNPQSKIQTFENITEYYYQNYENFIDTRKWPPIESCSGLNNSN